MGLLDELKNDWKESRRKYDIKLIALGLMLLGFFFIWEHLWTWGYLEFELVGHETLGLVLFVIGLLIGVYLRRWENEEKKKKKLDLVYK